jgi:SAM-dependent methyltransferase
MAMVRSFDPVWEESIYGQGRHLNRYPFDVVVSFVYRHLPPDKPRRDIRILEVGCGAGNNLWFAAREGFQVAGIDASASAIEYARRRLAEDGLSGDLRVGDFASLPFASSSFDLAIDRCALTCCSLSAARRAVAEVGRVLLPGGDFLFNAYSRRHVSRASGRPGPDGLTLDISTGTLVGVGQICFYGEEEVRALFGPGWSLLSVEHLEMTEVSGSSPGVHAEWRAIARKA